jgi:hypothetical protein
MKIDNFFAELKRRNAWSIMSLPREGQADKRAFASPKAGLH